MGNNRNKHKFTYLLYFGYIQGVSIFWLHHKWLSDFYEPPLFGQLALFVTSWSSGPRVWATPTHDPRITGDSPSRSCVKAMTSSCANNSALSTESWGDCFIKGHKWMDCIPPPMQTNWAMRSRHASTAMHFQSDNVTGVMCQETLLPWLIFLPFLARGRA